MKQLLMSLVLAASFVAAHAEEAALSEKTEEGSATATAETPCAKEALWPAFFAFCEWPETPDLIGLRLTIPFSTKQENVTGLDVGLWGRSKYFEGIQINVFRSDVKDELSGAQIGIYNSAAQADAFGLQVGLWNEAGRLNGVQCGLINAVGEMGGLQVGLINRAEEFYGFQIGAINIIRDAEVRFCPFVNIGF